MQKESNKQINKQTNKQTNKQINVTGLNMNQGSKVWFVIIVDKINLYTCWTITNTLQNILMKLLLRLSNINKCSLKVKNALTAKWKSRVYVCFEVWCCCGRTRINTGSRSPLTDWLTDERIGDVDRTEPNYYCEGVVSLQHTNNLHFTTNLNM